jgi:HEPN domain-containing protein
MNTSIAHLPAAKQAHLFSVVRTIVRAINPEKILLFGAHSMPGGGEPTENDRRQAARLANCLDAYELLIITARGDKRPDHELQDLVENRCHGKESLTLWMHDIDYVNSRLAEGHYFFSLVVREATLLYDAGRIALAEAMDPDLERVRQVAQQDFRRWRSQAEAFYRSALFNHRQEERRLAVFLLHQTAEQIYQAILLVFTGYKPCTHNLDKLRRYTNRFSVELAMLFPRDNQEEDHLFKVLLQGYVDARYKEEFVIRPSELDQLVDRIGRLLSISSRICQNRFISLGKMRYLQVGHQASSL